MEIKHTPGEWFGDDFGDSWVMSRLPDGRAIYLATIVDSDEEEEFEPDEQKRLANRNLMVGAPDLLAACKRYVALAQDGTSTLDCFKQIFDAVDKAEASQ